MKRFLVFSCYVYYPGGGWEDFVGDADTIEEARELAAGQPRDFQQVVDTVEMKEVDIQPKGI